MAFELTSRRAAARPGIGLIFIPRQSFAPGNIDLEMRDLVFEKVEGERKVLRALLLMKEKKQ